MKNLILLLSMFLTSLLYAQEQTKTIFDVARNGTVDEVKGLMKQNPDIINQPNENGFSPLILACYRGNTEVAKFLIDHVKDVNYQSKEGTALAGLSVKYNKELTEALLRKNADPNIADATGYTPLFWAVKFGNKELVELLLSYKADKSKKDSMGMTPFEYALQTNNKEIINLLKN
ncbi:ankyrin repeat domain-containing protein [Chryseobacterium gallinarum]|uniref:Ankyrin n=1 Tax=Chryseobacterium gallinarum TaxID=1324352 RepID=A0A0G3LYR5_CHRGL|nr:ankyrin repeat domain-containing protein [Chryseobacterium gallinarum]AKK72056.1 ankyrin [Chryseobacterium gallinarum]MCL8535633.1 ankyrin repeat domain-containing protein [Chryseobacterium gallinarum]QIY92283.1 ankyrin repeat domain-containing protein [Chryseobacterium gallinarum]